MKNTFLNELTLSVVLVVLAVLFLDPFMLWMPGPVVYMLIGVTVAVFAVFAGLIWKETVRDERDEFHKMIAGRVGYLAGAGVLVLALVWQTLFAHPDPWVVAALVAVVLGKLCGLSYSRIKY